MDAAQIAVTAVGAGLIAMVLLFFFGPNPARKRRDSD
jgi:hypothetical protein